MNNKIFTTDKFKVSINEKNNLKNIPVYISLVSDGTQNNIKLPSDIFKEFDGLGQGTRTVKTYFTSFEFEKEADACIAFSNDVKSVTIKPCNVINYTFENGILKFSVNKDVNFFIEPDGDIFGGLSVFCNKSKSIERDKENIIEFTDGVYTEKNSEYIHLDKHGTPVIDCIKSNTLVYIGENAVVNAAIVLKGVENIKISGTGTVSLIDRCHGAKNGFSDDLMWGAFRYYAVPNLYIRSGCNNIYVEDILLNSEFRGVVIRNSENIVLKNVKMFTSTENADGINCYNTSSLLVDGCYIQSADDCFCMYNSCDSIPTLFDDGYENVKAVCKNVEVKNTIMSSNARPIVLGGHATGETSPRCVIENINIHDINIIETPYRIFGNTEEYSMYWSGFLRLLSQSEQIVRDITFENITIDVTEGHNGKPVHLEVRGNTDASYTEHEGYKIENILFKNIIVRNHTEKLLKSLIKCRNKKSKDDECEIDNIKFENFVLGEKCIDSDSILCIGNVNNVTII